MRSDRQGPPHSLLLKSQGSVSTGATEARSTTEAPRRNPHYKNGSPMRMSCTGFLHTTYLWAYVLPIPSVPCTTAFVLEDLRKGFEYSLFLTARVFRREELSIARYICPSQLAQLQDRPLSDIPESVNRLKKNAPRMLRTSLQGLGFDKAEIDRMMSCSAMKTRVWRYFKYAQTQRLLPKGWWSSG